MELHSFFYLLEISIDVNSDEKALRILIKEFVKEYSSHAGSHPEESYHEDLLDDPAYKADSVYVPNDIKDKINKWAEDMGLKSKKSKKETK